MPSRPARLHPLPPLLTTLLAATRRRPVVRLGGAAPCWCTAPNRTGRPSPAFRWTAPRPAPPGAPPADCPTEPPCSTRKAPGTALPVGRSPPGSARPAWNGCARCGSRCCPATPGHSPRVAPSTWCRWPANWPEPPSVHCWVSPRIRRSRPRQPPAPRQRPSATTCPVPACPAPHGPQPRRPGAWRPCSPRSHPP